MRYSLFLLGAVLALSSCQRDPFIVRRSPCPAVAIPQYAGEITRFQPEDSRDESALDVTASITNLRSTCNENGPRIEAVASYDIVAQRRAAGPARELRLPVFAAAVRGGTTMVSKEVGEVILRFADGQTRAMGQGRANISIDRAEVSLPGDVAKKITRERKPGEADAALDPLSEPGVRDVVRRASFELLVGFQLTAPELAYNARQ